MAVSGDASGQADTDDDHCVVEIEDNIIFVAAKDETCENLTSGASSISCW
jgi:hypothetical protein